MYRALLLRRQVYNEGASQAFEEADVQLAKVALGGRKPGATEFEGLNEVGEGGGGKMHLLRASESGGKWCSCRGKGIEMDGDAMLAIW
jgi:hypothetical protein